MDIYLIMLVAGSAFFIISFIFEGIFGAIESVGEHVGDIAHDVFHIGDHDIGGVDHDHDGGGHEKISPFSIRNISAFFAIFGGVGKITIANQLPFHIGLLISFAAGLGAFLGAWQFFAMVARQGGTSHATDKDFQNLEAIVEIPILKGGTGQVRLTVRGQNLAMAATSPHQEEIGRGTMVIVREKQGGILIVVPK